MACSFSSCLVKVVESGPSIGRMMAVASHGRNAARWPRGEREAARLRSGVEPAVGPCVAGPTYGSGAAFIKLQGRHRGRDRFMNEAPTESSAETGLPRRALAAARPFLVKADAFWTGAARAATIGIFLLLLTGALDLARPLFLPLVSALVFALMFGPLQVIDRKSTRLNSS